MQVSTQDWVGVYRYVISAATQLTQPLFLTFKDRPMKNDVLIQAISEYKRKKFVEDMGCSKIFVDSVCIGVRQLGVIGEPSMAAKAADLLGLHLYDVRPDVYKKGEQ